MVHVVVIALYYVNFFRVINLCMFVVTYHGNATLKECLFVGKCVFYNLKTIMKLQFSFVHAYWLQCKHPPIYKF
jgi:hypothetical protein